MSALASRRKWREDGVPVPTGSPSRLGRDRPAGVRAVNYTSPFRARLLASLVRTSGLARLDLLMAALGMPAVVLGIQSAHHRLGGGPVAGPVSDVG